MCARFHPLRAGDAEPVEAILVTVTDVTDAVWLDEQNAGLLRLAEGLSGATTIDGMADAAGTAAEDVLARRVRCGRDVAHRAAEIVGRLRAHVDPSTHRSRRSCRYMALELGKLTELDASHPGWFLTCAEQLAQAVARVKDAAPDA